MKKIWYANILFISFIFVYNVISVMLGNVFNLAYIPLHIGMLLVCFHYLKKTKQQDEMNEKWVKELEKY